MTEAFIRDAKAADFPSIAALNAQSENFLSPMNETRLERLHGCASYHRLIERDGAVAAFLLAFREAADYDSPNYRWFSARYRSFVYIDRVVVAPAHRGNGLATSLYLDVFVFARKSGVRTVTVKVQLAEFPLLSRAVQVTVVVPLLKLEPLGGAHETFVTAQLSVAVAE